MLDGLWTEEIQGLFGWEHVGVLVFDRGNVLGGGNNHFSIGRYQEDGETVEVTLAVEYHGQPRTVFGSADRRFDVTLRGRHSDGVVEGEVHRSDRPDLTLAYRLTRRTDLP